jgi:hypothetical protein
VSGAAGRWLRQVAMRLVWLSLQVLMSLVGRLLQVHGHATLGLLLGSPARLFAAR